MQVKYVVMPISIEQKKEYNRQGFRVVDARFAPTDAEIETQADGVDREVTLQGAGHALRARRQRRENDED